MTPTPNPQDDGGPAFPWGEHGARLGGMSLRDVMAMSVRLPDNYASRWAEALIGEQLPNAAEPTSVQIDWWMRVEAAYRYRMADAMLRARQESSHDS